MYQKLKSFLQNDTLFTVIVILLLSVASFGLGRLSMQGSMDISKSTENTPSFQEIEPFAEVDVITEEGVPVVVSRSGTKYHLLDCPGALQMKEENRIEFDSIEAAKAAGYKPAGNCPGI